VKVGVVGCGKIASAVHMPSLRKIQGYDLVAASDLNPTRLQEAKQRFGVEELYNDYHDMLIQADIDAVFVCTPPEHHFQIVMNAIEQGKHVLCEKPISTSLRDGMILRETYTRLVKSSSEPLLVMPAHNYVFTPCFIEATKLVDNGEFGKISKIDASIATNLQFYGAKTDFRNQAKSGVIEDLLPHMIYLVHRVAGPLQTVSRLEPQLKAGTITHVNVKAFTNKGVEVQLRAKWTGMVPTLRFELWGETGSIRMDLLRRPYNLAVIKNGEAKTITMGHQISQYIDVLRFRHPSYTQEHIHFLECTKGAAQPSVSVDDGVELVRALGEVTECFQGNAPYLHSRESVAVLRVDNNNVEEAVQKSIDLLGGINIQKDALVAVKPNVCFPRNLDNMIITDPRILEAILRVAKEKSKNVVVVESDAASGTAEKRLTNTGVMDLIKRCDAEFLNLSKDDVEEHKVGDFNINIPKTMLKADYIINLPKIKTHPSQVISIAMKNMFGTIANPKKSQFHSRLTDVLIHLNQTIRQDFVMADGIVAMEGLGPIRGNPVNLGLLISGRSAVAVDAACCHVAGFNPYAVEVLWKAHQQGIGEIDRERIQFLGDDVNKVKTKLSLPTMSKSNIVQTVKAELQMRLKNKRIEA
jgi:predicted dehydrogenase/uncharacterized protein (DUF362 family)